MSIEAPEQKDVYEIGTIATIKQIAKMSKDKHRVLVTGQQRAKLIHISEMDPYMQAEVQAVDDYNDYEPESLKEMPEARSLQEIFLEYSLKSGKIPKDVATQIADIKEFKNLVNKIAAVLPFDYMNMQDILEENDLRKLCS